MHHQPLALLLVTAATIGCLHTALGPDHYVPFIAMARAGRWSFARTITVTLLCGVGHVLSSAVLGVIGIAGGFAVGRLNVLESQRGGLAGWLMVAFGLAYMAWGIRRAFRNRPHTHWHAHPDGVVHRHRHTHTGEHAHVHADGDHRRDLTPWILFTIFVFGPCEPLIPLLIVPAAEFGLGQAALVTVAFAVATLVTMTAVVTLGFFGVARLSSPSLTRYAHATAGFAIAACGLAIQLGL